MYNIKRDYSKDALFDELGLRRLRDSYMMPEENSPQDRFAKVVAQFSSNQKHAERMYSYVANQQLSLSTPILAFGRTKNSLPISCYLSYLPDTSEGLVNTLQETCWLSMGGGGIGIHIDIRSSDSKSVGVMRHLKVYEMASMAFKQNSTRRGSYAAYLDLSHPDIIQFIEMRKPTGDPHLRATRLNHGVNIPDKFMEIIERCMLDPNANDDWELIQPNTGKVVEIISARYLWQLILETRMETGEPYIWFIDTANKALPQYQKDMGLKIHGSNLCVIGDTLLLTSRGHVRIADLENEEVEVWNGESFSTTKVQKTGTNQKVLTVTTDCGRQLTCTEYHKFYVKNSYYKKSEIVQAKDLRIGDKLEKFSCPIIEGDKVLNLAYQNGFFSADGCRYNDENIIYLYGDKRLLSHKFDRYAYYNKEQPAQNRIVMKIRNLKEKFFVPGAEYTVGSRLAWFAGLLDGDGCVLNNNGSITIQLASVELDFLKNVQLMLQTIGVSSKIKLTRKAGKFKLPANNGSGELKLYNCKEVNRLLISAAGVVTLRELDIPLLRLDLGDHVPNREAERLEKIASIEYEEAVQDTFCVNEPIRHRAVFNGILTGNCSEISLATSPERTAVCCLSSINLEYYDEISTNQHFLKDVLEFLDNVLQYFIDHAPDSISRARYSAMRERSVGVGALGFHAYLQKKGIAFESASAKSANIRMFKHIRKGLDKANRELAEERGPCPDAEGKEMKRCSHVMAIAPNASTSIIMGNTSPSIEPFPANAYRQDTISGAYVTKNRFLDVVIRRYQTNAGKDDRWYNDVWSSIISNDGSVQHLEFLSEHERMVFKTAREIDQRWVVEYAGDRQVFIDQAQSVNLYFNPTVSIKMLHAVHFKAWKMGLKGLYYCRSTKLRNADAIGSRLERKRIIEDEPQVDLTDIINNEECLACEG